jgi:hypothetical protein
MTEEIKQAQSVGVNEEADALDTNSQYINTINDLNTKIKTEMVSKESYNQLKKENQQLLNSLVNGNNDSFRPKNETFDRKEAEEKLIKRGTTNLDFWKSAIAISEEEISKGHEDPMVPHSRTVEPTSVDFEFAENLRATLKQAIEDSEGDPDRFRAIVSGIFK